MSFSVYFKTQAQLKPDAIVDQLMKRGERIMIENEDFPCFRFGRIKEALRGIEINKENDGYEVKINYFSSRSDYEFFVETIDVMMKLLDVIPYTEEDEPIDNPYTKFNSQWIDRQQDVSWETLCVLIREYGNPFQIQGFFIKFIIGPNVLKSRNFNLFPPYEDNRSKWEHLIKYFTWMQWTLVDCDNTQSNLAMDNIDGTTTKLSLITIKDGKVTPFKYISYEPLIAVVDLDSGENIVLRFEDFAKATDWIEDGDCDLSYLDEYQKCICSGEVTVEYIKRVMEEAKRYIPNEVSYKPSYPGSGYDEKQNTVIFMWNTETGISLDDYIKEIKQFYTGKFNRKVHEWKDVKMDDRFYVVKVAEGKTGVVMAGILTSQPYVSPQWSGKGRKQYIVELKPTMMINSETAPMIGFDELEKVAPDFMWRGGYSGRVLTQEEAMALESLFAEYLKVIKPMKDGFNICFIE